MVYGDRFDILVDIDKQFFKLQIGLGLIYVLEMLIGLFVSNLNNAGIFLTEVILVKVYRFSLPKFVAIPLVSNIFHLFNYLQLTDLLSIERSLVYQRLQFRRI